MKLKFLGTAAAEGWPALFCDCLSCRKAAELGGKNIRSRSSCLINDNILVDFPSDTYMHKIRYNLSLSKIEYIIVTHSHMDHFYPKDLEMWGEPYAHKKIDHVLNVYGNDKVGKKFENELHNEAGGSVVFNFVEPNKEYKIKDTTFVPLLANHDRSEKCYIYVIKNGGKTILYGHDSGYFYEETWEQLNKFVFDLVILDCTLGPKDGRDYHMGIKCDAEVKKRLMDSGRTNDKTKFIITHFSHNGGLLHDEIEKLGLEYGFIAAYDGMDFEI